jgi:ABC-2 type transport system ATP-binding protein
MTIHMIKTTGLTKNFELRQDRKVQIVEAVKGIDLVVNAGETFAFLGPNGAGKTTTLRMLTTLIKPSSGEVQIAGFDLARESKQVRARIGYVSQAGGTDISATALENLLLHAQLYGISRQEAQRRSMQLLSALELESYASRLARTYSGGQRRRLDLALGIVNHPQLLFLDEPTTGLDPQSRAHLWDEVRKLNAAGTTVFLTTHYLEEADALADRLAIIDDGLIVAEGTPESLKKQISGDVVTLRLESSNGQLSQAETLLSIQPFVRELHQQDGTLQLFVEHGEESLPSILRLLDSRHLGILTLSVARPTLDDVFLMKTGRSLRDTTAEKIK